MPKIFENFRKCYICPISYMPSQISRFSKFSQKYLYSVFEKKAFKKIRLSGGLNELEYSTKCILLL